MLLPDFLLKYKDFDLGDKAYKNQLYNKSFNIYHVKYNVRLLHVPSKRRKKHTTVVPDHFGINYWFQKTGFYYRCGKRSMGGVWSSLRMIQLYKFIVYFIFTVTL